MAKKNAPEVKEEQKIQTKYDRKMAERKAQEKKDKRDEKIFKIVSSVIGIVLVLAIVIGIGSTIVKKQVAVNSKIFTITAGIVAFFVLNARSKSFAAVTIGNATESTLASVIKNTAR